MGWEHRLSDIDEDTRTARCATCGLVRIRLRQASVAGPARWRCGVKAAQHRGKRPVPQHKRHRQHVGDVCGRCGFVPEDVCQLDVHHLDGNHSNNDPSNLATLCANCHRLIHYLERVRARRPRRRLVRVVE